MDPVLADLLAMLSCFLLGIMLGYVLGRRDDDHNMPSPPRVVEVFDYQRPAGDNKAQAAYHGRAA